MLTAEQFHRLADVPAAVEWLENITNPRTRRAYEKHVTELSRFVGVKRPDDFRTVTRAHVIAWRKLLEREANSAATIRAKLSALSSLFEYLCERNSVESNPVKGVKRPTEGTNEGKTPAISDGQARLLLNAPDAATLKGKRDRAIISTFLFHAMRREELCALKVRDFQNRRGVMTFRIHSKREKLRYVEAAPGTLELIQDYLEAAGHAEDKAGPPSFGPSKTTPPVRGRRHLRCRPSTGCSKRTRSGWESRSSTSARTRYVRQCPRQHRCGSSQPGQYRCPCVPVSVRCLRAPSRHASSLRDTGPRLHVSAGHSASGR